MYGGMLINTLLKKRTMKKNIFMKHILLACSVLVLFSACRKVPEGDLSNENPTAGTSYIGFTGSMESSTFFEPFTNIKTVDVFSIKKDAANPADLQKTQTITVKALPDAVPDGYTLLPQSFYTLAGNAASQSADGSLTFNFAPGDFQKTFAIKLDGSKLDLSATYILPYQITNSDGLAIHAASKDTLYAIFAVKNAYDGVYTLGGTITRYKSGTSDPDTELGGDYPTEEPFESEVATIGPNANTFELFWKTGGGIAGVDGLQFEVDPTTKLVTVTAPGSPGSLLHNTPGEENYYDPGTKTFHLHFTWGATNKRIANITLTYSKSR